MKTRHLLATLAAALAVTTSLHAQFKSDFAVTSFDRDLEGFTYTSLPELAHAMVEKTDLVIRSARAEKVVLVAGVVDARSGEILYASVSAPLVAIRNTRNRIAIGRGPLRGAWDAFEDPLFGFEDPLFGFEDPLFGFEDPLFGFEDRLFGFEDPLFGFETRSDAIDAVWGTAGVAFAPITSPAFVWGSDGASIERPRDVLSIVFESYDGIDGESFDGIDGEAFEVGIKLLIVTSVSLDPDSELAHSAAILPFWSFSD